MANNVNEERDLYARPVKNINRGGHSDGGETYVAGMYSNKKSADNMGKIPRDSAPVVGFLYSISNKGLAEYWPLHLGTNTIGKSSDNDIQLQEASISAAHAMLSIKQMKTTGKLIAYIRDIGSKNGVYLNDEELDYEGHACKHNDVITIGDAYKLLLIIIDAKECGLSVADNFMELPKEEKDVSAACYERSRNVGFGNMDSGATMAVDGKAFPEPGETQFM